MKRAIVILMWVWIWVFSSNVSIAQGIVLRSGNYKHYIDSFNLNDNELYKEYITNDKCWEFLSKNIPLLDCPDKNYRADLLFQMVDVQETHKTNTGRIL